MDSSQKGRHPRLSDGVWRDREKTREMVARHPPMSEELLDKTLKKSVQREQERTMFVAIMPVPSGLLDAAHEAFDKALERHSRRLKEKKALARARFCDRVIDPIIILFSFFVLILLRILY